MRGLLRQGRAAEADAAWRVAAELARRHGDPLHAARISWLRAMPLEAHGRLHEARALLREAATECELHGDLRTLARIESTLGSLALEEGRLDAARTTSGPSPSRGRRPSPAW